jgi:hypothetical protein
VLLLPTTIFNDTYRSSTCPSLLYSYTCYLTILVNCPVEKLLAEWETGETRSRRHLSRDSRAAAAAVGYIDRHVHGTTSLEWCRSSDWLITASNAGLYTTTSPATQTSFIFNIIFIYFIIIIRKKGDILLYPLMNLSTGFGPAGTH